MISGIQPETQRCGYIPTPQSPDLSDTEHLWDHLKKEITKQPISNKNIK